jgi:GNAT superfamily N-acetyltransferase
MGLARIGGDVQSGCPLDGVLACALADARFHQLAYAAFGVTRHTTEGLWWVDRPAAPYFMSAGTLSPRISSLQVLDAVGDLAAVTQVRDCWGALDLSAGGFEPRLDDPWMVRPPWPVPEQVFDVPGLEIRRARTPGDVLVFERTAVPDPPPPDHHDGDIHPADTPTDGDLHFFTGFLDGRPVATALAAVHPQVVMVGAVRTRPQARGRGIGTALSAAAVAVAPDRPAALGARPLGVGLYRRLGFTACGHAWLWTR